ncbi:ABC transporter permease [Paenibacillus sp. SYP-B3998]|uniref:ABC transporter permease n=1 Tax=Paenibacillus sp. SYP-B3998 TaxID=2678564 RepID=A0A6G3ZRX7_9BACL|nr:ABC transporter permease [Paenibacillus sp. SYP-B3998]NEW04810.1 ABC transporter permease [Paenibacillus sp. SYP-B3998]
MNFRQFAFNNILRNKRAYMAYFLSSAFSVMIFFTYALLLFHPNLQGELASSSATLSILATMGMKVSQYLIFIFSFFFLLYSVSAFLKMRKKEFGILMLLGISPKQLNKLVFIENMFIGIASIMSGVVIGLIFSKLILLISASVLFIQKGLPFYVPIQAVWMTGGSFFLLFLVISLFTARLGKRVQLVELMQSEDRPKPEPKSSILLALLAITLIGLGYAVVFFVVLEKAFSLVLLTVGVALVVLGTYFLFTQLSVHVIRALKKNERLFFRKTNVLTLSELTYRMKDNAIMFFIVATVLAVAFTGMGSCLALANPGLAQMMNPYAFTYVSTQKNQQDSAHLLAIKQQLKDANFAYRMGSALPKYTENGLTVVKLTDFNSLAEAQGYPKEMLSSDDEIIYTPANMTEKQEFSKHGKVPVSVPFRQGKMEINLQVKKAVPYVVLPNAERTIVVTDSLYDKLPADAEMHHLQTSYYFIVENWKDTQEVSQKLKEIIKEDVDSQYHFRALVFEWITTKQQNGILLMVSVLVGIVFFTFAASFIYFRLYADMERDERQYQMISKIGLTKKELRKIVTGQLLLMFFLPIVMAIIHSGVAFAALQQLIDYSVVNSSITIFASFVAVQLIYYFIYRWCYLQHLYQKMV